MRCIIFGTPLSMKPSMSEIPFREHNYLSVVSTHLGFIHPDGTNTINGKQPTLLTCIYSNISDDFIRKLLKFLSSMKAHPAQAAYTEKEKEMLVALKECATCVATKNAIMVFQECAHCTCKGECYYSKVCQKNHWKVHKRTCNNKWCEASTK